MLLLGVPQPLEDKLSFNGPHSKRLFSQFSKHMARSFSSYNLGLHPSSSIPDSASDAIFVATLLNASRTASAPAYMYQGVLSVKGAPPASAVADST